MYSQEAVLLEKCQMHGEVTKDIQDHEVRIRVLEKDSTVTMGKVDSLCRKMDKVESNTTWILRLIIGAIILALLGQIFIL